MNLPFGSRKISNDEIDLIGASRDASFYSIKPKVIVYPQNDFDIISLFQYAHLKKKSITFRAAGTSLSGQGLTNSILADISKAWKNLEVKNNGVEIKTEPGVIAAFLNQKLSAYRRVIGPDPASLSACMLGGIIANNSSGMRSGINRNAYNTIKDIRIILANGVIVDTEAQDADENLKLSAPDIYQGLLEIRDEILKDKNLIEKITNQYKVKNTVGYSLNSFIDYQTPLDILMHLMVGSEGTLAFISNATLQTFVAHPVKLTGILVFPDVQSAASAIMPVRATGVSALEIVDNKSLQSVKNLNAIKQIIGEIDSSMSILLFEFQESTKEIIEEKLSNLLEVVAEFELLRKPLLTWDSAKQVELWSIRSGLLPSLGGSRTAGTTFILEDICFPLDVIHKAIPALIELFEKYDYRETGIYGHGMDGNLHFMLTQNFDNPSEVRRYKNFMDALAELVIERFGGSMKAEHGTGRNIAPFVERQWGEKAYSIMKRIKKLFDPDNILNAGVLINEDENCHIKNIKNYPVLNNDADKCIECGFCEPVCPSADLTLSPRKRIVMMRCKPDENIVVDEYEHSLDYNLTDTCAVDGLCSVACPIGINTGELVKNIRKNNNTKLSNEISKFFSGHFNRFETVAKSSILAGHFAEFILGEKYLNNVFNFVKRLFRMNKIYHWNSSIGYPSSIKGSNSSAYDFVYFPTCISRIMGKPAKGDAPSLFDTMKIISEKAGYELKIPPNIHNYCCGTVFTSKGYHDAYVDSINRLIEMFWNVSDNGKLPIIFDASSCLHTARTCRNDLHEDLKSKYDKLSIIDVSEFLLDYVLPKIQFSKKVERVVLHQTCSTERLNIENKIKTIAEHCANDVIIPESQSCCGMAGDRGLIFPELNVAASQYEKEEIVRLEADGYYSSNLPCETAMSSSTGKNYRSIAYLVLDAMK